MSSDGAEQLVPRFDGREASWLLWKAKFIGYLVSNDLLSVIEEAEAAAADDAAATATGGASSSSSGDSSNAPPKQTEKQMKQTRRVYGALMVRLYGEALEMVVHCERGDAHGIWRILLTRYERNTVASKLHLRRQLRNMRMQEGKFDVYVSHINQLCLRLKQLNSEVNAEEKLFVMLE